MIKSWMLALGHVVVLAIIGTIINAALGKVLSTGELALVVALVALARTYEKDNP